jgi:hypothetical protein
MRYRVDFVRVILGVSFTIASVHIRRARNLERAMRAAELRFTRRTCFADWRERADKTEIASAD